MQVKNVANASAKHVKDCRWRTASVEGETTKYSKYSKRAAAPQDCMWVWLRHRTTGRVLRDCASTLSLVPSRNSNAREILLRSLSPEYADGTLMRSM